MHKNQGFPTVNHKRVYRIMKENKLTLQRNLPRNRRTHEGKIITDKSDMRWCSDIMGIRCWDGDMIWIAFILDCHDREVISYICSTVGITSSMIQDIILEAKEQRFGDAKVPKTQFLSDNGPQYTAFSTIGFCKSLGFAVCHTPAYSPESNGMAEAFVKTFKRDYVYINNLQSVEQVMLEVRKWIDDYNSFAPHKGLSMCSPKEFRLNELSLAV